jgi:hypothetical protein
MLAILDDAIERLVLDGTAEVEVRGQRYRAIDLDKLIDARTAYQRLADRDAADAARPGGRPVIQRLR